MPARAALLAHEHRPYFQQPSLHLPEVLLHLLVLERKQAAVERALELTGCYVVVTDVAKECMPGQAVHDSYVSLRTHMQSHR